MNYELHLMLRSDATFGRGDGLAGLVDTEVEHDPMSGLPYIRGRVLKGLLVEECANILFALHEADTNHPARLAGTRLQVSAQFLFGQSGSGIDDGAQMRLGPARLPEMLCEAVQSAVQANQLTSDAVLNSLTIIRRQTAQDDWGAPRENSLRAQRALLRQTTFVAPIYFDTEPDAFAMALLAACIRTVHRGGMGRNRGRGRLQLRLCDTAGIDVTEAYCLDREESFAALLRGTWGSSVQQYPPRAERQQEELIV